MMTDADRLREIGERLHGARWQSAIARDLNVNDRRISKWLSGDPVPSGIWAELAALEAGRRAWPRDEWIIGTDAEGERDYIIHTRAPRFMARFVSEDAAYDIEGLTYETAGGEVICEIAWIDPAPLDDPSRLDLMQRAETAIDIYTADSFEAMERDD